MKYCRVVNKPTAAIKSRPARGARIEILCACGDPGEVQSRPARGARIEMRTLPPAIWPRSPSRPARGARIEICCIE